MKRYLKNFVTTYEFIKDSIYLCLNTNSRWRRIDTKLFLIDYYQEYLEVKEKRICSKSKIRKILDENLPQNKEMFFPVIDWIAEKILLEIKTETVSFPPIKYDLRYDGTSAKIRKIGTLSIKQQLYDYVIVNACKEMLFAKFGHYQVGAIPNKGQKFAKESIEYWTRRKSDECKYIFKGDIHHFYNTVNHDILKKMLARDIKSKEILYISYKLIDSFEEGLCIGSFVCQYWANYYLSYLYHYVSEFLYSERRGKRIKWVNHILFQMDDLYFFSSNKKYLKMAVKATERYLNKKLDLELKPSWQIFPLGSRPIDVVGFKIYQEKTTIRSRNFKRIKKVCKKILKQENKPTLKQAKRLVSYNGFIKYSNSNKFNKQYKIDELLKNSKEVISNEAKKC